MKNNEIKTFESACQDFKAEQQGQGNSTPIFIGVAYEQEDLNPKTSEAFYHYLDKWQTEHLVLELSEEMAYHIERCKRALETTEQVRDFLCSLQLEEVTAREIGAIKAYALSQSLGVPLVRIIKEEEKWLVNNHK